MEKKSRSATVQVTSQPSDLTSPESDSEALKSFKKKVDPFSAPRFYITRTE